MADFTIDVSRSKTSRINLGIQGENIIEHIIFNISSWIEEFGEGDAYVYAQRKGDENPYPVALDMDLDAGTATWTLNATDTAVKGKGKAQLVYVVDEDGTEAITDDEIKKTRVFSTTVQTSLIPASEENPDAYETWLEVLGGYTARIEAAEDDIKAWVTAQINAIDFPVDDVQIDGTSVVSDGVAVIPPNVQSDWNQANTSADDYIKNKPTIPTIPGVATTSANGLMSSTDKVKLNGIEAGAEANVQSDWNQTNTSSDDYINNKPGYASASQGGLMSPSHVSKLYSLGVYSFTAESSPLPGNPNRFSSPSSVTATLLDGSLLFVKFPTMGSTGDVTLSVHKQDVVWGAYIPVTQNALPISPSKLSGRTVLLTLQGTGPSSDGRFEAIAFFPEEVSHTEAGLVPKQPVLSSDLTAVFTSNGWDYFTNYGETDLESFIQNVLMPPQKVRQTFTASSSVYGAYIDIPYDADYTHEDLLDVNIYYYTDDVVCPANYFKVIKYDKSGTDVWRYVVMFSSAYASGATIAFENLFTDTDAEYSEYSGM